MNKSLKEIEEAKKKLNLYSQKGKMKAIRNLINKYPSLINWQNTSGNSALMIGIKNNKTEVIYGFLNDYPETFNELNINLRNNVIVSIIIVRTNIFAFIMLE